MGMHYKVVSWFTPDAPDPKFIAKCKRETESWFKALSQSNRKYLIRYLKDENGNRVGVLLAYPDASGTSVKIGWSVCNTERDRWNKYIGLFHAFRRAALDYTEDLPSRVYDEIGMFYDRCTRYFLKNMTKSV